MAEQVLTSTGDRSRAFAARLIAEARPAVIINCLTSEIVAANAGGLSAIGVTRIAPLPYPVDSAMPAITAIRELANGELQTPVQRTLIFWRNGRAVPLPCTLTRIDVENAKTSALATHVTIIFQSATVVPQNNSAALPQENPSPPSDAVAANDDSPPRIIRDDSETLKEIARKIREAQNASLAAMASSSAASEEKPLDVVAEEAHAASDTSNSLPIHGVQSEQLTGAELSETKSPTVSTLAVADIAKLAHELKTPLTAIAAAAEIMRDQRLGAMGNDKYLGYAADIHSSATHALAVIQDMLALPSIDAERRSSEATAFDLTELARSTVSSLQPLADRRRLILTLDVEPGLTPIHASATAVRQILLNLLTNALKFTPPGGEVRVVTGYLNDGAVFMVVRDTGDGIDEATLARVFEGGDELGPRAGGGRGIGLRLVRTLAAENGAEFEIDSAPGKGTIVMLAFAKDLAGSPPTAPPEL